MALQLHGGRYRALNRLLFFSPPNAITSGVNQGGFTCYFHDPDQIVLEMVQPPPHRLATAGT